MCSRICVEWDRRLQASYNIAICVSKYLMALCGLAANIEVAVQDSMIGEPTDFFQQVPMFIVVVFTSIYLFSYW